MNKSQESLADVFGSHVFSDAVMRVRLPKNIYRALQSTIQDGVPLDAQVAEVVASVMKDWAVEQGATHFTHWFQPMTGLTAEKHDSFISPSGDGNVILEFSGKELIKGEPDASSFPSGGMRTVFEARGYTAWDVMSPAFVREDPSGIIALCIPTAFCSFTGDALDLKTPLLRSMEALNKQALRVLSLLGDPAQHVWPTVGAEQEYFLVDKSLFLKRRDLSYTGRTLIGAPPPKGQYAQYYATIQPRVSKFMAELNEELWKLGVPAKTQHHEAAPAQHELAQVYTTANIACDHNQLTMELMKKVADRHGLTCLLHEKPFRGMSGSGKHNNWSLKTDDGRNLLNPGKKPQENTTFWVFFLCTIAAVDEYALLLRAACASAGNEHRLGGHEAPPHVLSVFIGDELAGLYDHIIAGLPLDPTQRSDMHLGVSTIPTLRRDTIDRNRTSPFAFTGDKFELRMLGSSMSVADVNTYLNTTIAEMLRRVADRLERAEDRELALQKLLVELAQNHRRILFNGNNYSQEWQEEARKRGLPILDSTVEAYRVLCSDASVKLFESHGVFSHAELESRVTVKLERYALELNVEAKTLLEMARGELLPACIAYAGELAQRVSAIRMADATLACGSETLEALCAGIDALQRSTEALEASLAEANRVEGGYECARACQDAIRPALLALREDADALERLMPSKQWPIPTYGELLYTV